MPTNKATPGPWFAYERDERVVARGTPRFHVGNDQLGHSITEIDDEANAKLIAAAPDLLEALKTVMNTEPVSAVIEHLITEAIKKAEGDE